ncbi:MAG TPA: hypothetical protein VKE70_13625 [Candidatus Solibacter sp.]|nr:hypothetical protein [Candidatus Solibacter sp.]
MLRYDPQWLLDYYADEPPVCPGIPYSLLPFDGRVERVFAPFQLTRVAAVEGCLAFDETIPRLMSCDGGALRVQPCRYSDGVRSNYAMDGPEHLRDLLGAEYGRRLPPLSDARLSNSVGTAIVLFTSDGKPYLPRRAPRQSVYPAGFHCTASGDAVWRDDGEMFESHICRELEEEAGLTRADLDWIRVLALCREFLRGGKPQFFFAGQTSLRAEELAVRRRKAIAGQIARGRQEILDEVLEEFNEETASQCTMECLANLALARHHR